MRASHPPIPGRLLLSLLLVLPAACSAGRGEDPIYSGTIEATQVDVIPEVGGLIVTRPVDQGDPVEVGDVIATIQPDPYRIALAEAEAARAAAEARLALLSSGYRKEEIAVAAREVEEAEAQATQAEARIRRVEDLVSQEIGTQEELDAARRDRDVWRSRLAAARQRLALVRGGYRPEEIQQARAEAQRLEALRQKAALDLERTTVRSPLKGTVTEKLQEPGELARPGSPIVSVADLVNLYTWVYLSVVELPKISVGDQVAVQIDGAPGRDFPGKVVYISKEAEFTPKNIQTAQDRVQLVFGVKVAVPNPDGTLKVGIPADVILKSRQAP